MELFTGILIFIIAFASMFLGALSGGVGLIIRPILIFLGFNPQIVIGTSRASSILGDLPGLYILQKSNKKDNKMSLFLSIPVFIGSMLAVFFAITADTNILKTTIGIIILATALFLLLKKNLGNKETKARFSKLTRETISFIVTIVISFLSTIAGGLGPVYTTFYSWLYGKTIIQVSIIRRSSSYFGGFIASMIFVIRGIIDWQLFIILTSGFMLGNYFGTHYALKKNENWTRNIIIIVAIASAIKLLIG